MSGFGGAFTTLALQTLVIVTLGRSVVGVGWLNAARWLPLLLFGVVVGALVDRVRRRPVMVSTDLLRALLLLIVPIAWLMGWLSLPLLLTVVALLGMASLVNDAASQSFIPRLVPTAHLQRAHARLDGADAVAQTAGPAVAGLLIRAAGAPVAFVVNAATYVYSAVAVVVSPLAGLLAAQTSTVIALGLAAAIFGVAALAIAVAPMREIPA